MWVRIDDGFADHPKVLALGPLMHYVRSLQIAALCYAARHLTDGYLDAASAACLFPADTFAAACLVKLAPKQGWADVMVKAGLWDRVSGGYQIHDYLDYNPPRAKVLAKRARERERRSVPARLQHAASTLPGPVPVPITTSTPRSLTEGELREGLPAPYHPALEGVLRASRDPVATAATIRALGPGGIHERYPWDVIGRALFELAGSQDPGFHPKRLEAFCRRLVDPAPPRRNGAPPERTESESDELARVAREMRAAEGA